MAKKDFPRQRGMTLIEILVAMSLLAILSVMGYKAFGALLIARERLMQTSQQWVDTARAFRRVESDLTGLTPQTGPADAGAAMGSGILLLEAQPEGQQLTVLATSARYPGGGERIRYRADAKGLSWSAGDATSQTEQPAYALLPAGIKVRWRVLLEDGRWLDSWPQEGRARALEMRVTLPGPEMARRVWVLP